MSLVLPRINITVLLFLKISSFIVYSFSTNGVLVRNTPKYFTAKISAAVASIGGGMFALRFTGTESFWGLAAALLAGQLVFKYLEERTDSLATAKKSVLPS